MCVFDRVLPYHHHLAGGMVADFEKVGARGGDVDYSCPFGTCRIYATSVEAIDTHHFAFGAAYHQAAILAVYGILLFVHTLNAVIVQRGELLSA